ncbi:MAG: DUF2341 domain-containing protein, partial [Anaerolineales bacterium]
MKDDRSMRRQYLSIRVLIANDDPSFGNDLEQRLAKLEGVQVVGKTGNGLEAVEMADGLRPDVVFLAQDMPGLSGVSAARRIKARWPKTHVIFIAEEAAVRDQATAAGAAGFFVRRNGHKALLEAIQKFQAQRQWPTRAPDVKKPSDVQWGNPRVWKAVGVVMGLALLGSIIFIPGISLPLIALISGLLFFVYGLKYYASVALILAATSGVGNGNGNGNGFNGVFNGFGATNGIKNGLKIRKPGLMKSFLDRILGREPNGLTNGLHREAVKSLNNNGSSVNGFKVEPGDQPFVSIHLPLYNETRVVDRLLEACTRLDYKNYEILIADDSTDETLHHLERWAKHPKVRVSHRINRTGFKGAALKHAMEVMDPRTNFIAIFDADFIPPPGILHQFLSYFYNGNGHNGNNRSTNGDLELVDESLAVVQGYQWHVLNASENWITRGIRTEFSGSYVVERPSQELTGGMKMISGSVFMIRADLLRNLGWGTSITEDWELTIRLYLEGYRVLYSPFIQAPAECVADFKQLARQRMRWSEGHTFNVKKYFFPLLRSPKLTRREKLEFLYYAPYYLQSIFFIIGTLAWLISEIFLRTHLPFWTATLGWSLVFTNTFALIFMNTAGLFLERGIRRNLAGLLSFVLLTFLLVPYQAYASLKGLLEPHEGGWHRTDKTGVITDIIDKLGMGRRMRRLMPKKKKSRSIDIGKRLGLPAAKILERIPAPIQRVVRRVNPRLGWISGLVIGLILLWLLSKTVPIATASPDVFSLRDTTNNGASPKGEDMYTDKGSNENTLIFDSMDDGAYWYSEPTYITGDDDTSFVAGDYTLELYFNQLPSSWWDTDYLYREQITITAGSVDVPADYSIRIEFDHDSLTPSQSLPRGDDIRIVYWNRSEWIELDRRLDDQSYWDTSTTQVWFRTQVAINAYNSDKNYYMYYGNEDAGSPPTDWSNIFLLYDNFNDGSFDNGRWACGGSGSSCTESGGTLTLGANSWVFASPSYAIGIDTRWEARIQLSNAGAIRYNYWGASDESDYSGNYITYKTNDTQHEVEQNGTGTTISTSTPTSYHNYIFDREGSSGVRYTQDTSQLANLTSSVPTGNQRVFIWVDSDSRTEMMDWVRVRKYVIPEPTTTFDAREDAPYVKIVASVYHSQDGGGDAQAIVTSSMTTIDANTSDPYRLHIGTDNSGQIFTVDDPRRLRVNIDVKEVNGSGSFTLAYNSADNPSSLNIPAMTMPGMRLPLLAMVVYMPILIAISTNKRRLPVRIISVVLSIIIVLALLTEQVLSVSAAPVIFNPGDVPAASNPPGYTTPLTDDISQSPARPRYGPLNEHGYRERLDLRQRSSTIRQLFINGHAKNRYVWEGSLAPRYYQDVTGEWFEIDTNWRPSNGQWDVEMVHAEYNAFAMRRFDAGELIKYLDPASGQFITFQPLPLQYTNDLGDSQEIADPQPVEADVTGNQLYWTGAFGPGLDLKWVAGIGRLDKRLIIQEADDLPRPSPTIAAGANPSLRLQFLFRHSSEVGVWVNGKPWREQSGDLVETRGTVEFRSRQDGRLLWKFNLPLSYDAQNDAGPLIGTFRFRKTSEGLIIEHLVPLESLRRADYPLEIDVTIDNEVGASADDAHETGAGSFSSSGTTMKCYSDTSTTSADYRGCGIRWTNVTVPKDAKIDVAYLRLYVSSEISYYDVDHDIYFHAADTPANFVTNANILSTSQRPRTSASTSWIETLTVNTYANTPSIVSVVQEIVNRSGWASSQAMVALLIPHTGPHKEVRFEAWDTSSGAGNNAILHIEYTTLPAAPSNCQATYISDTQIDVNWNDNSDNETGFKVESSVDGGAYSQIETTGAGATSYPDTSTSADHSYQYRVRATNSAGDSDYCTPTSVIYTSPSAPSDVTATHTADLEITISWTDNSQFEDRFRIERSKNGGLYVFLANDSDGSPFIDDTITQAEYDAEDSFTYQLRAEISSQSLVSAWATSNALVVPEWVAIFLFLVPLIPYLMSVVWQRKKLLGNLISLMLASCIALGMLATSVPQVEAAPMYDVSNSTTLWWYDDTSPLTYMMYQSQPSGSSTSASNTTVSFYSDTWPDTWQIN